MTIIMMTIIHYSSDIPYLRELALNNNTLTEFNENYYNDYYYDADNQILFFRHPLLERIGPQQQPPAED